MTKTKELFLGRKQSFDLVKEYFNKKYSRKFWMLQIYMWHIYIGIQKGSEWRDPLRTEKI